MTNELPVAQEILRQIGGRGHLTAMIGAHSFVGAQRPDGLGDLSFQFKARARDGIKGVRITLDATDTYTVVFAAINKRVGYEVVREFAGVYCDQLRKLIEDTTGLALTLYVSRWPMPR